MDKTNKEISRGWKNNLWPHLRHAWLFDKNYYLDDVDQLQEIITAIRPKIEKYADFRGEYGDCDDHQIILLAEIRKKYIDMAMAGELPPEQMKPRPVGRGMFRQYRGIQAFHALCIAETKQGTFIFEGAEDRIWKADPENDTAFFLSV